ncbi:hypothetical protein [Longimicrobium sp.]|uniref:hypothetical protein n=1 Tax=Longimicrobium sp. TaxID=2029185 RepID=UPI002E32CEA7|nr:hypothetical protein [Longimicrobium sp.]HEX6040056.1 hypothetical protein [Longimicrobium sp.]
MYRNCIFCSAALGANDVLEHFPVGRSVAFDGAKGRLWAVCPRCARWNLSPIEERWETIEDAERLFRDSRIRAQSENIGLARLKDGTRLIRVGRAQPGELVVWRYGHGLIRRRQRLVTAVGAAALVGGGGMLMGLGIGLGLFGIAALAGGGYVASSFLEDFRDTVRDEHVVHRLHGAESPLGRTMTVRSRHLVGARLVQREPGEVGVMLPALTTGARPLVIGGLPGRRLLSRAMVHVNAHGAKRDWLHNAVNQIAARGTAEEYLHHAAQHGKLLLPFGDRSINPADRLALEIAVHEETERGALAGELAALEEMWRQAEEIARLADALPDEVPDP